ncbi:9148_t:CDS:2, partial [Cetraspora pellucida]
NAIVAGFSAEYLQSSALEFNLAVSAHLFGFVFFEIPSSLLSKVLGFHVWIPIIMVCWGITSMCQASVTTSLQLGIVRFLLGVAEAGFSPAVIDYICLFYARKELTMRYGIFIALCTIAGAFTGLLAYGIVQIKGAALKSFQLIFLIEGIPTIFLALVVAVFFTKGPGNARFLTPKERLYTIERLRPEGGVDEENRGFMKSQAKSAFLDPRVYVYVLATTLGSIPFNALNYFLPTLVSQLGFSPVDTQLMSVPPYVIATVVMIIFSWLADKYQVRALPIMIADIIAIIGCAGMIGTPANDQSLYKIRYFFTTLIACGVYTQQTIVYSWLTCNIIGQYKRNITIATALTIGNVGGVVGILLFQRTMAPAFSNGMIVALSTMVAQFVLAFLMKFHLEYVNKKLEHEPKFDDILCDSHPNW